MKWILELDDNPLDYRRPFVAYVQEDSSIKSSKRVYSIDEIMSILEKQHTEQLTATQRLSDVLPLNAIKKVQTHSNITITMVVDKQCWDIKYQKVTQNHYIGFPRLVIQFTITTAKPFKVISMRVAALREHDLISNDTPLYAFPFPNVEKSSGNVCINFEGEKYETHADLDKAFKYFMSAPFNEDYSLKMKGIAEKNFASYLSSYENTTFDDARLIPIDATLYTF